MGNAYHGEPTPAAEPARSGGRKPRARKRPKGAPTHVRSWPLRPDLAQCAVIRTRFFTGARVYNAVLGEFIARSRMVKSDPHGRPRGNCCGAPKKNGPPGQRRSTLWRPVMGSPPL